MSDSNVEYAPGDTYSYRSVTQGHTVTWTRDDEGTWRADDDRGVTATDADVRIARGQDGEKTDWAVFAKRLLDAGRDDTAAAKLKRDTLTAIFGLDAHKED
jgi:hypothetical protein